MNSQQRARRLAVLLAVSALAGSAVRAAAPPSAAAPTPPATAADQLPAPATQPFPEAWSRTTVAHIELKDAHLADIVAALSRMTGLSVIADPLAVDPRIPALVVENVPEKVAIDQLAGAFDRRLEYTGRVLLLRDRLAPAMVKHPDPVSPWRVGPEGLGKLTSERTSDGSLELNGAISQVSLEKLGKAVAAAAHTPFTVTASLASRRVTLTLVHLPPAELAAALAQMVDASASVALYQTTAQQAEQDRLAEQVLHPVDKAQLMSNHLTAAILPLLSAAQLQAYNANEFVPFSIDNLPPGIRSQAIEYAQYQWAQILPGLTGVTGQLDLNKPIQLVLKASNMQLAVTATTQDGMTPEF